MSNDYKLKLMINKKIGIIVTSNNYSGIAKLSAIMANDISKRNNKVYIYVPIIPYYTFFFKIFNRPFFWLRKHLPEYLKRIILGKKFTFEKLLNKERILAGLINIKFVFAVVSEKELSNLDCLILNGIGDVIQYQNVNVKKKIYLVNQLEEINSGNKELFRLTRKSFKGEIVTHCNFMKKKLSDHIDDLRIVPNPISEGIWKFKDQIDIQKKRKEILIYWKNDSIFEDTDKILKELLNLNSDIKVTIFARSLFKNLKVKELRDKFNTELFFDLDEISTAKLYLEHTFLLYPNRYEDFGMPPVEALACGCIPILNPTTGAADMYSVNNFNSIHLTYNSKIDAQTINSKLENTEEIYNLRRNSSKNINQFQPKDYGLKILN